MGIIRPMEKVNAEINMKIYHNYDSRSYILRGESKCPEHTEERIPMKNSIALTKTT